MSFACPTENSSKHIGWRLVGVWLVVLAVLVWLTGERVPGGLVTLALLAWDLSLGSLVVGTAVKPWRRRGQGDAQPISVLIAAFNEEAGIVHTVASVLAQEGADFEVLVGDDGSRDATAALVERTFAHDWRVRVWRFSHGGKAATLNRLLSEAHHPIIVTLDADTELRQGSLAAFARRFADTTVEAASGVVLVRQATQLLTRFQASEYVRNNFVRAAWARLSTLEQVPGACAAFRASALRAVQGFPEHSITEDYEVVYRLYAKAIAEQRQVQVDFVPEAVAFTDGPTTLAGFVRQRTRWFAGFLTTLVRFRSLIFARNAGAFGMVKLPLKVIDAVIPLTSLLLLAFLIAGALSGDTEVRLVSLALFTLRWLWDAGCYVVLLRALARLTAPSASERRWLWACAVVEALSYAWLRYVVVLRAYPFAIWHSQAWEASRTPAAKRV